MGLGEIEDGGDGAFDAFFGMVLGQRVVLGEGANSYEWRSNAVAGVTGVHAADAAGVGGSIVLEIIGMGGFVRAGVDFKLEAAGGGGGIFAPQFGDFGGGASEGFVVVAAIGMSGAFEPLGECGLLSMGWAVGFFRGRLTGGRQEKGKKEKGERGAHRREWDD